MSRVNLQTMKGLDRLIGADLAASVRASTKPWGTCSVCNEPLGTKRPLILDHRDLNPNPDAATTMTGVQVNARHLTCVHVPGQPFLTDCTWRGLSGTVPMRVNGSPREIAVLFLNPSGDHHTLLGAIHDGQPRFPHDLLDVLRGEGQFATPGHARLGVGADDGGATLTIDPGGEHVLLTAAGTDWLMPADDNVTAAIREHDGALVAVSYRHDVEGLREASPDVALRGFLADDTGSVHTWAALSAS